MAPTAAAPYKPAINADFLKLETLRPSPLNPRKRFDAETLKELADNIAKNGVIVPLIVRRTSSGGEIIDGERRFRAATIAQAPGVPVIYKDDLTDGEVIEIMLLNQIQRQDLTPLEEAAGFSALIASDRSHYSAAYIGDRIGRSEKFVIDRMRLTKLIPILKTLLEAERILVGHAELLCTLKVEDQGRAVNWNSNDRSWQVGHEGLWQTERASLAVTDDEDPDEAPSPKNLYRGLKPVTVKELESWIKRHVRFDVEHMAKTAPLEFGQVAKDVEHANALPGKGKKVIAITHDYRVDDEAKDPNERTYGSQSWVRADGKEKSKTCEFSVLGVVVAGRGQGSTLQVCVNRDKCTVHFGKVIKDREKSQQLRQQGKGGQAAQLEQKAREAEERRRAEEQAERERIRKLLPAAEAAIQAHIEKLPLKKVFSVVAAMYVKGAKNPEQLIRALAVRAAVEQNHYMPYFERDAKKFGFDVKAWFADQKKAAAPETGAAPAKAAKKATKR